MKKETLLFYDAYQQFYRMADRSDAFRAFCRDAFGSDFSQDGFSDLSQVDRILPHIPYTGDVHILDIGCGNGKMVGYLQKKTGAFIHGFDYSETAIQTAQRLFPARSDFRVGIIGETDYPDAAFDVVTAMDTLYFAKDMTGLVRQIKRWLKPGGVFFAGYTEGDVVPRTENAHTTLLAKALSANAMDCQSEDITEETYALLQKKRAAAQAHRAAFLAEGNSEWYRLLLQQTDCAAEPFSSFREKMARYLYTVRT
jgi:2-polyprenyl-3-methyl-5-hydroxy-6-metoxy-1,4-benzoquinol methylase